MRIIKQNIRSCKVCDAQLMKWEDGTCYKCIKGEKKK